MNEIYETAPPTITLTLLESKHISPVYRNLAKEKFLLYLLGKEEPVDVSEISLSQMGNIISLSVKDYESLPGSSPQGISEGVLLVSNSGGEVTVIDVEWVTGVTGAEEAYRAFLNLSLSKQKSYIHSKLLENILV